MRRRVLAVFVLTGTVALATLAAMAGSAVVAPAAAAATPTLPRSPAGQVSVLSANAGEFLYGPDIAETRDIVHLGYRVQAVLDTLHTRDPAGPYYAPDVVLLQEVTKESAANVVQQLTAATGYTYKIAADALTGTGAWEQHTTPPYVVRETAIAYNAATMQTVGSPAYSLLTYPQSEIPPTESIQTWVSLRQATIRLKALDNGRVYGVYSTHYRPARFVVHHDAYTASWTNFLKKRVTELYPGDTPIIGGDFNSPTGAFVAPFTTSTTAGPGVYQVARPQGSTAVDAIASTEPIRATSYDYDYKTYGTGLPTYFDSRDAFLACDSLYNNGQGGSTQAQAINGCTQRYYSDHAYIWAVLGT